MLRCDGPCNNAAPHAQSIAATEVFALRIVNETPLQVAYLAWHTAKIAPTLTVIVKATFDLVGGGPCRLAKKQSPPLPYTLNDVDAMEPSVRHPSDFALAKPRAEVLLAGTAHAPAGEAVQALAVGFSVGSVAKQLTVIGDRQWVAAASGHRASAPQPFVAMPLSLERCFGGPGFEANPLGVGVAADGDGHWPLPNIEHESARIATAEDRPYPASAFPTPPTFQSRIALAGSYDDAWLEAHWPALPPDFDFAYFNEAPLDQQLAKDCFRGDERIVLDHLHPQQPRLVSDLPGLRPRCAIGLVSDDGAEGADAAAAPAELLLGLDTITIDADLGQVFCVWRGLAQLPAPELADSAASWLYVVDERIDGAQRDAAALVASAERAVAAADDDGDSGDEEPPLLPLPPLPADDTTRAPAVQREPTLARIGRGEVLFGVDLGGVDLSEADLAGANLAGAILAGANLAGANLAGAALDGAVLAGASLRGASLRGAQLGDADLCEADLAGADLAGATLAGADMQRSKCQGARFAGEGVASADLSSAELAGADLSAADLSGAQLGEADLSKSTLDNAKLAGATLDGASIEGASCVAADFSGASASDLKASGAALSMAKLDQLVAVGALFRGAELDGASFVGATLDRADLSNASAAGAQLVGCRLRGARLFETKLAGAALAGSDLFEALLESADLSGADLRGASFFSAELMQAQLDGAQLAGADLRRTKLQGRSA